MNYPVPFIAILTLGSKFLAQKYNHNKWSQFGLLFAFFTSTIVFYAAFAHLVPSTIFCILTFLPIFNALVSEGLDYFGLSKYSIPVSLMLNAIAVVTLTPLGFWKTIQAAWSLGLISSVVATINTDYIKPLRNMRKKHEYSV
ncbi:hypothetical protein BH09DEP1_BH09DEP1_5190 [soil metagenome]